MSTHQLSGQYTWEDENGYPFKRERIHLDVDGESPLMAASGTASIGKDEVHWISQQLVPDDEASVPTWTGLVHPEEIYLERHLFHYNKIQLEHTGKKSLRVTFFHPTRQPLIRTFTHQADHFREVTLEFDTVPGRQAVLDYDTHSHENRPARLAQEQLTVEKVFERAGFQVNRSDGDSVVNCDGAIDGWSDGELHNAMQYHFSLLRKRSEAQNKQRHWELWVFSARTHANGALVGGKMFDQIDPPYRQGTAVFLDSFISTAPADDGQKEAWRRRMAFWTTIHEIGHGFNLTHCWEKQRPWIWSLERGYDLRSFMNYPYRYQDGRYEEENAVNYFKDFLFKFTDQELLFLRHAPEPFVQMGGESLGEHHAFESPTHSSHSPFELVIHSSRQNNDFEFLEPVVLELKLTNRGRYPRLIPNKVLEQPENLTIQVRKPHQHPMELHPFVHSYWLSEPMVLKPNKSVCASHFISVGSRGWMIDDPGYYDIQVCLHLEDLEVYSNTLRIRVAPPRSWDEQYLAQDFFSDDVARVLAFDGCPFLENASDTLREIAEKLQTRRVAVHARVAIQMPEIQMYRSAELRGNSLYIGLNEVNGEASESFAKNLIEGADIRPSAVDTLGHIDFAYYVEQVVGSLVQQGRVEHGLDVLKKSVKSLKGTLSKGAVVHLKKKLSQLKKHIRAAE